MDRAHRILIVEDEAILALSLQEMLVGMGYEVTGLAATGLDAIAAAREQRPDAILMDINLRDGMNGIEAAGEIHGSRDVPIVYLTAYTDESILQQAKISDAYAYLIKPVRERELRASLEMAFYKHESDLRLLHLNQVLGALRDINQLITRERDSKTLLDKACRILLGTRNFRLVWIGELDGSLLRPIATAGEGSGLLDRIRGSATVEQGKRLPGSEAARTRRCVVCPDMLNDERYAPWKRDVELAGLHGTIAVPLLHEDRLFGVLSVYSDLGSLFDKDEAGLLLELADDIAFGLNVISEEGERRRGEELIARLARKNEMILNAAGERIVGIALDGSFTFANPAAAGLLGYDALELIGKPSHPTAHHHRIGGATYPEEECPTFRALRDGSASRVSDEVFWRRDGSSFPVEYVSTPIFENGRIEGAVVTFIDITERQRHQREVESIAALSAAMRSAKDREAMLPVVVEQLVGLFGCEAVTIEIIDSLTGDTTVEAGHGLWAHLVGTRQRSGMGINAIIAETRRPYHSQDLSKDPHVMFPEWACDGITGSAGIPLIAREKLIGFVWVGRFSTIDAGEVRLLSAVADIVANAIQRATLHEQTMRVSADLVLAYDTTLEGWARALELRDHETEGHARRVVHLTLALARSLEVDESEMENMQRGALLHDIGKMGIPDSVLLKPGSLDDLEWDVMRRHPEHAFNLLSPIGYLHGAIDLPYAHHEKWDGSGYPRGLRGKDIPLSARIFAVVDVWDALRSDRPYRQAWSVSRTLDHLQEQAGKHFDPRVVAAFVELVGKGE